MATYTIVASTTDPLGPGEIAAGSPILVSEGDVFIIDPSADAKITFEAEGGVPANFDVVINDSNTNVFEISVLSDLTPTVTVADNVDASGIKLGAANSDAVNFTAGDNVQFGEYAGSATGADTIVIGDGFATTKSWSTSGGDDSIIVGLDATFNDIDGGLGNDTISLGDRATTGKIQGGAGDDSITIGKDAAVTSVDGEGGNDSFTSETNGITVSNVENVDYVNAAYISEIDYDGGASSNFVEIAVPDGVDASAYTLVVYDTDGTIIETFSLGSPVQTIAGNNVYLIDDTDAGWVDLHNDEALALVDDTGSVVQFISFKDLITATEGPATGMDSTLIGEHSGGDASLVTYDGGVSYSTTTTSSPGSVPCYAPGTMIDTPDGPRAVETLRPGDLVMTLDHGPQAIRWTRSGDHPLEDVDVDAKPVQIKAGALGHNLPAHDLIVSPQHRILVGGVGQLGGLFASEAFAPAKSLTAVPGIRHMKGKTKITWIHFACDRHEVVFANGCLSESLLLGPMVVNALSSAERRLLTDLFGSAMTPDAALNGPPARECLTVGAAKRQLAKHIKDNGKRFATDIKKWDRDLAMERSGAERLREAAFSAQSSKTATHAVLARYLS